MDVGREVAELFCESLRRTGCATLRAQGTSMLPALLPDDTLTFAAFDPLAAAVGDIVLLRCFDALRVHRIAARHVGAVVTRGDRHRTCDPPVADADVLGTLVEVHRGQRRIDVPSRHASWLRRSLRGVLRRSDTATRAYLRGRRLIAALAP